MLNKFLLVLSVLIFISCQKKQDCSKKILQTKFEKFDSTYSHWKYRLNYMDEATIQEATVVLDSSLIFFSPCNIFPADFRKKIDSVSIIFGAYNIERKAIENAEKMVMELDSIKNATAQKLKN